MRKMQALFITLILLTVLVLPMAAADSPPTLSVNILAENGTVRVYGTVYAPNGLDRVEVKIDDNSFRTADITGNNFSFTGNITVTGNHVALIRAFDVTGAASTTETKTFYATKLSSSETDDISFFVRTSSLKVTTFNSSRNVREMEFPEDFCVEFTINNDDTVSHKIRYRIDVNGEELTSDVTVKKDGTYSVSEWYAADSLSVGQNRIKVTLIDWETKEQIEEKNLTVNLLSGVKPTTTNESSLYPEWLEDFASANGLSVPDTTKQAITNNSQLQSEVSQLKTEIERLKANQTTQPIAEEKSFFEQYGVYLAVLVIAAVVGVYLHKNGKLDAVFKKKEPEEEKLEPK